MPSKLKLRKMAAHIARRSILWHRFSAVQQARQDLVQRGPLASLARPEHLVVPRDPRERVRLDLQDLQDLRADPRGQQVLVLRVLPAPLDPGVLRDPLGALVRPDPQAR